MILDVLIEVKLFDPIQKYQYKIHIHLYWNSFVVFIWILKPFNLDTIHIILWKEDK